MDTIEKDRGQLTVLYLDMRRAQQATNIMESNNVPFVDVDGLNIWDDIELDIMPNSDDMLLDSDATSEAAPAPAINSSGLLPIEDYLIPFPSNGNMDIRYRNHELTLRSSHAEHHLSRIRDLIAEKKFQYSHVVRVSPCKGTTTRSRASVKKLKTEIALHCRMYTRCRACLIMSLAQLASNSLGFGSLQMVIDLGWPVPALAEALSSVCFVYTPSFSNILHFL